MTAFEVRSCASAARALEFELPESVAVAAWEFIDGPVRSNPRRVGKVLHAPLFALYSAQRHLHILRMTMKRERETDRPRPVVFLQRPVETTYGSSLFPSYPSPSAPCSPARQRSA